MTLHDLPRPRLGPSIPLVLGALGLACRHAAAPTRVCPLHASRHLNLPTNVPAHALPSACTVCCVCMRSAPFSRIAPQRGFSCIDVTTFRRALCYVFGEQWTILAMTSEELIETYSP